MALTDKIDDLAIAVATEVKRNRTWINGNMADLSGLNTTNKNNLVAAINEVKTTADSAAGGGTSIDDDNVREDATYSSSKIEERLGEVEDQIPTLTDLIDDTTASGTTVYSSTKTDARIAEEIADLFSTAPDTLDTINEIAQAIQDNAEALADLSPVKYVEQTLTSGQQLQARTNIGAAAASDVSSLSGMVSDLSDDIGDIDTADFVTTFESGLE